MTTKVCYFIQSHRDPEQIYRLVHTLRRGSPAALIVVQHNLAASPLDWGPLADLPDTHQLFATAPQVRSHFSCQVQPYLDLIEWLEASGKSYDWVVNLTAQDYPVRPIADIESSLESSNADAFLRFWDVFSSKSPWSKRKARARYWHRYWRWEGHERALRLLRPLTKLLPIHFYLDYGPWVGVRLISTPFRRGFRCYGGWAWFALRREAVLYLRSFLADHPEIDRHYRNTKVPEESLVQTALVNSGRFCLVNDDRRYIDYSQAVKGSPRVLTTADMPLLSRGGFDFARKFDLAVDRQVLDAVDRELLGMVTA